MFVNGDAIYGTRPWVVTNEGPLWFTRSKDRLALYAIVEEEQHTADWKRGQRREFVLKTARATASTTVSVLGQSSELVEYRPELDAKSTFHQEADGLHVSVMRAQRMRDSDMWPLPTVIRLTDVEEAFKPPVVHTLPAVKQADGAVQLRGTWVAESTAPGAEFGFEVRNITGEDRQSRLHGWERLPRQPAAAPGTYVATFKPKPGEQYEFRSVLVHPLLTLYGETLPLP